MVTNEAFLKAPSGSTDQSGYRFRARVLLRQEWGVYRKHEDVFLYVGTYRLNISFEILNQVTQNADVLNLCFSNVQVPRTYKKGMNVNHLHRQLATSPLIPSSAYTINKPPLSTL